MKIYRGERTPDKTIITVEEDGKKEPLRHIPVHSPTGMEWGYEGSGPSDLSLAILADHLGHKPERSLYMTFKQRVIAALMKGSWVMTAEDIEKSLEDLLPEYRRRNIYGNRNIDRDPEQTDSFYCGETQNIDDEEHAISLGLYKAYNHAHTSYVIQDGTPRACMPIGRKYAHGEHLWLYGTKGKITCECGKYIREY